MRSLFKTEKEPCSCGGLRLIGDVHGEFHQLSVLSKGHRAIQIGDIGFGFTQEIDRGLQDVFRHRPDLTFMRGNHDKPSVCKNHMRHHPSGMDPSGIFFLGGGFSIDYMARVEGVSWWKDEEHSYAELETLVAEYRIAKPRMVVSHEGPKVATSAMFDPKWEFVSRTAKVLGIMFKIHEPELWCFGHWHKNKQTDIGKTRFVCVGENQARDVHFPTCEKFSGKGATGA